MTGCPLRRFLLTRPRLGGDLSWTYLPTWAFDCTLTSLGRALDCVIVAATAELIATARLMTKKEIHICAVPIVEVGIELR